MGRCMGDAVMRREFPDSGQRSAVCRRQLAKRTAAESEPRRVENPYLWRCPEVD